MDYRVHLTSECLFSNLTHCRTATTQSCEPHWGGCSSRDFSQVEKLLHRVGLVWHSSPPATHELCQATCTVIQASRWLGHAHPEGIDFDVAKRHRRLRTNWPSRGHVFCICVNRRFQNLGVTLTSYTPSALM
jgi:hypothetical protein